jgi:hypothetical protein
MLNNGMTPSEMDILAHKIATLYAWHLRHGWRADERANFDLLVLSYQNESDAMADRVSAMAAETLNRSHN